MMKNCIFVFIAFFFSFAVGEQLYAQQAASEISQPLNRARIVPTSVKIDKGTTQQFNIVMVTTRLKAAYNPDSVTWSVNGIVGGNSKLGTISKKGLYQAPANTNGQSVVYITGYVKSIDNPLSTATVLFAGPSSTYKTVLDFNEAKTEAKYLKNPTAITVEKNGNILITDKVVHRYSPAGKFINSFGKTEGDIEGHFDLLTNIKADKGNKIFISDQKITPHRIMAFSPEGSHLYSFGNKGSAPGMSFVTRGMAFDSKNRLYIGDVDLNRVSVFDNNGKYQFHFGTPGAGTGQFNGYYDLALDMNDDVFIANYFGPCQKYDAAGHYLFSFASPDPPHGIIYTTDIATDSRGNVYVAVKGSEKADGNFNVVKNGDGKPVNIIKYNNNGDPLADIVLSNPEKKIIRITVDKNDRLLVLYKDEVKIGVEVLQQDK